MGQQKKLTRAKKIQRFASATQTNPKSKGLEFSPEQRRRLSAMKDRAIYLDFVQLQNGPGFFLDRKLREFVREYNNRVFEAHGSQQPESFNVLRDFVEPDDDALVLKILPENHFSVDLNFIFDRLTDPATQREAGDLFELEEGIIHSVAVPGGYEDLQFVGVKQLALFGWSCVRHGDELSIFALTAKNNPDKDLEPIDASEWTQDPSKPFLPDGPRDLNHEEFYDYPWLYPIVFLMRVDLSRGTTLVRYILTERKQSFDVVTDNRETYTFLATGGLGKKLDDVAVVFDRSHSALQEHSEVFALLAELPHVLIGISDNEEMTIVRTPTELRLNSQKTQVRKAKKILAASETPNFVNVATVVLPNQPSGKRVFNAVQFKVEQKGYWKDLRPDQMGIGKNGDQIQGKTWVEVTESWEETFGYSPPENSDVISVRSSTGTDEIGEIYVMRSALHPKDVYKVGFTTKSAGERASQLKSTSGQPDQFGVMNSWTVRNPRRVEGIVHERLKRYRVNPRREFFKLKYAEIQAVIEQVVAELNASLTTRS